MAAAQAGHTAALAVLLASARAAATAPAATGDGAAAGGERPTATATASAASATATATVLVNAVDAQGATALMLAAKNGHSDAVRVLLSAHADPYTADSSGFSALELACRRGSEPTVRSLLGGGGEASRPPAMQLAGGLMLASKHGHVSLVTLMMDAGERRSPPRPRRSPPAPRPPPHTARAARPPHPASTPTPRAPLITPPPAWRLTDWPWPSVCSWRHAPHHAPQAPRSSPS